MKLFLLCFLEVFLGITVCAQPRYRMMVDPPVQVVNPPPNATFVNLCFREQGSVNTNTGHCPLGVGSYLPNGPDQPIDMLDRIDTNNTIPPAYPTEEIGGNITILGVGLLVNIQDSGLNSLASHIFTQIGGEAPGTLFTIPSTQINGTSIVFTITIGATCLEEDTGVDCNSPPVTETTEITTTTSTPMPMSTEAPTTEELASASTTGELTTETQTGVSSSTSPTTMPMTTEAPTIGELTTMTAVTQELTTAGGVSMTSSTSPTTTEGGADSAGAQSIVPIAAGVGGGVAALLLLLLLVVVVIVMRKRRSGKRNKEYRLRQTDANDLNHYDASAGNAGTSGAGNIESSGALPLYAVVDTSDDVPLEESLYEFTDGNGVPSRDGGGVGGGIDEESKPAHTKTDYEDTYNIPDSNAYNTIAQHGSQDGEVTYNQLSHGQNQEEATYNQLSHGQNQEEATYNQLSHGQDQEEATYNQLSHGQNQEEATYNQLSHGQDQEEATYNQLSHNQPSRGGEIPYNKLSHGQNQEVTYNQLSVGHQRKQLEVHGSQEGLSTYASLGQPETREPSTGQENESVYYNTAAGTQNPDKKHDPMNVGTEAHNGTNNEVYYNTGDLKQASPGKHVYTDVNVTSSPMKSTSTPGSNSQKPVVYSDINSVLTAFSSK